MSVGVHLALHLEPGHERRLPALAGPSARQAVPYPRARWRRPRTPKGRAREVARRLAEQYPDAVCELDHRNAFELLAATILSAQTTDVRVNMVTPTLFARYPDADAWPPPTRARSRRSSARPASTRTRPAA